MRYIEIVRRNVRVELAKAGLSQRKAALLAGIAQPTFSDRMHRNEGFKVGELVALAAGLQIPVEALLADLDSSDELNREDEAVTA